MNIFHRTMLAGAAILAPLSMAQAATIVQNSIIPYQTTDFSVGPITLNGFDSTLGTLTGVQIDYTFNLDSEGALTNQGAGPASFTFRTDYYSLFTFTGPTEIAGSYSIDFSSGPVQYINAPVGVPQAFGAYNFTDTGTLSPLDIAQFIDTDFTYAMDIFVGNSMIGGGGNVDYLLSTYGGGNVSVTYTYDAVPEPATWAMLIAGFGMVGFAMRRRQRMASVSA